MFPPRFWTHMRPWLLSSFWFLPFEMEMSNQCLFFHHCILKADNLYGFHSFTTGEFCLRMNHTSSLAHIWFRWYLDEIWDLELMMKLAKTSEVFWWGWMYFAYKYMNFGGPEGGLLGTGLCIHSQYSYDEVLILGCSEKNCFGRQGFKEVIELQRSH